jgi:actin-related protein 5
LGKKIDFPPRQIHTYSFGRVEEMIQDHCLVSQDFAPELRLWSRPDFYQHNVHRMQLPFTVAPKQPPVDPELLKQRRQDLAKRLVEMNAKKREEKLMEDETLLKTLHTCLDLLELGYEDKVKRMLTKHGLIAKNVKDLNDLILSTKARIEKVKTSASKKREPQSQVRLLNKPAEH